MTDKKTSQSHRKKPAKPKKREKLENGGIIAEYEVNQKPMSKSDKSKSCEISKYLIEGATGIRQDDEPEDKKESPRIPKALMDKLLKLKPKQQEFVLEYLQSGNSTQAAKEAGYA
jgi:phage terminase small subunit